MSLFLAGQEASKLSPQEDCCQCVLLLAAGHVTTIVNRVAKQDVRLGDKTIRQGQLVYLSLLAANHDPTVYSSPHRFEITRREQSNVAFGHGPHICLGGNLARLELEVGLSTLIARYPNLRLDASRPAERNCSSLSFRGFHSLNLLV